MPRLPRHWNQPDTPRTASQTASAVSVNLWRLSGEALLALENEGFDTRDWSQRMDVIEQFVLFGVHLVDRAVESKLSAKARADLVRALAEHLAALVQDNRQQSDGRGEYRTRFIEQLNECSERYAALEWSAKTGPGFNLCNELGEAIAARLGGSEQRWIATYVIDREAPKFATGVARSLRSLLA